MNNKRQGKAISRDDAVTLGILDPVQVALEDEIDALTLRTDLSVTQKIELLSAYLNNRSVQSKAIEKLTDLGEQSVEILASVLHDPELHEWNKWALLTAIGKIGGQRAADVLLGELSHVYVPDSSLIRALGLLGDERAIPRLIAALEYRETGVLDMALNQALPMFGNKVIEPLIEAVHNENPNLRGGAIQVLGIMQSEAAFDFIVRAIDDPHAMVRFEAVFALKKFGKRSWPYLRQVRLKYPQVMDDVFNYGDWTEIDAYRDNEALKRKFPVAEVKTAYRAKAEPCPICEKLPNDLTWVCLQEKHLGKMPMRHFRWITVCEDCHLQVQLLGFFGEEIS